MIRLPAIVGIAHQHAEIGSSYPQGPADWTDSERCSALVNNPTVR
jgi:hypothetical protein